MPACEAIGECCGTECARVGRHVHAVGEQRHRSGEPARDYLHDHHPGGERNHPARAALVRIVRSEEHTSELQSLMRISYAVFCLKKKNKTHTINITVSAEMQLA